MITWSLSAEFFALILVVILILSSYDRRWAVYPHSRLFHSCLWGSVASILLNILCVFTISQAQRFPLTLNILLNSAYFLTTVLVSAVVAYCILYLIYEHSYRKRGFRTACLALAICYLMYFILILVNVKIGAVFYFDAHRQYQRGPLINSGYLIIFAELFIAALCAFRNRQSIGYAMRRTLCILPPIILLLIVYQIAYSHVLLNGGILLAADIILLLNFQSRPVEQDSLTSIGSRSSFYHELDVRLKERQQFQIIVVAIRQLGSINQRYGHVTGDSLIYESALWLDHFRRDGHAFRLGSVAFALLLPYENETAAHICLREVCDRFQEPWTLGAMSIELHAQFAELIYTNQDWSATDIMEFLKYSLSLASEYTNGLVPFDENLFTRMKTHHNLLPLVRNSIRSRRFQVWYQPIYHTQTKTFASAEALLRLQDEDGTLISPSLFIPLAEQTGLIDDLNQFVLEEVCRLLGCEDLPQLESISVNLSMQQFSSPDLIARIVDCVDRQHVAPKQLKLEITERVLTENFSRMRSTMENLHLLGFGFSLDDFGTGYSNLSALVDCPFSCVKLDHSLISDYPENRRSAAIVNTMLKLFHSIGFQVVAEGVETAQQAEALTSQGADWIQGYYYAVPMSRDDFVTFLRRPHGADEEQSGSSYQLP